MKRRLLLMLSFVLVVLLFSSNTCRKWGNPYDRPPSRPVMVFPDSGAVNVDTGVILRWRCTHPDTTLRLRYDIYLGTVNPPALRDTGITDTFYTPHNLLLLTSYFWRVVARDRFGDTAGGPIYQFTTRRANSLPYAPHHPFPESGAANQLARLRLSWRGGDPDQGDTAVYDIYLGTSLPPSIFYRNCQDTYYIPEGLKYDSTYYWRVVARDKVGDTAVSSLWHFSICPAVRVLDPVDTTRWRSGANYTIRWTGGVPGDSNVIYYSSNNGITWPIRVGKATTPGSYSWTLPVNLEPTDNARIQVRRYISRDTLLGTSPKFEVYDTRKPSAIRILAPDSLTEWTIGSTHEIIWDGGTLLGMDSAVISYSTNNGLVWSRQGKTTRPGRFLWSVPAPVTNQAKIRVRAYCIDSITTGISATFRVVEGLPAITITEPNSRTRWREGSNQTVTWTGGPAVPDSSLVFYSTDDGSTWLRHGRATVTGSYPWQVPGPATTNARVQVRSYLGVDSSVGTSERYVVYDSLPPTPITVTSPAPGVRWTVGSIQTITWTGGTFAMGMDSTVIFYSSNGGVNWARQGKTIIAGSYEWQVPPPTTNNALIRVKAFGGNYTSEGTSGTFTVAGTGGIPDTVVATVTVGSKPRALLWDSLHNKIFVANYNSASVSVIDGASNQVTDNISVGANPYDLCLNTINGRIYVGNYGAGTVSVIDGATNQVLTTINVGSFPQALCFNSTNNRIYVANYRNAQVKVIDGATNEIVATISVDSSPIALVYNPVYNKVYCANFARNSVTVIDGSNNQVLGTVGVDYQPCALVVDGQGNVAVANRLLGKLSIINGNNQGLMTTINVGGEPWALAYNSIENRIYVANSGSNTISVVNALNYSLITTISVGNHPRSLAWAGWVDKLYCANYDGESVNMIDCTTNVVRKTLSVGQRPIALCGNSVASKVYVANYDSGTVTIIGSTGYQH
ncbi:MAG: YncE family protein [bacterium]